MCRIAVLVTGIVLAVAVLVAACGGGSEATRERLSVCVDSATFSLEELAFGEGEGVPDGGVERVTEVLVEVTQHPFFADDRPIVIDEGCPLPPPETWLSVDELAPIDRMRGTFREHDEVGAYRAYVFFLPDDDVSDLVGGSEMRTASQEITCLGDICGFQSLAAYLSEADLDDETVLVDVMEHVTLLSQVAPTLPPGETETGTPPP